MRLALALIAVLTCSAATCQRRPPNPEIVYVTVEKTVTVDERLTRDCHNEPAKEQTYLEAKRLANLRGASLDECTGRMREIRALGREQ